MYNIQYWVVFGADYKGLIPCSILDKVGFDSPFKDESLLNMLF